MSTTATQRNERNYRQWAIKVKALLRAQSLWKYVSGQMRFSQASDGSNQRRLLSKYCHSS